MMTYEEQRKQRLDDVVFDYIQDETVTPKQFHDDLIQILESHVDHYQERVLEVNRMIFLVNGESQSPDMSRYSQYDQSEIDAMCHEADRVNKEDLNLKIQANSPYNDGWTREFYKDEVEHSKYYYDFDRNR
jgi:hypothetical protein